MPKVTPGIVPVDGEIVVNEFHGKSIRKVFHDGEWWFCISDVVATITDTDRPSKYWSDLKHKLTHEGFFQLSEKIGQLKMVAPDGKERLTDAAPVSTLLRIVQSIGSPKAEVIKKWLAKVGFERLQEFQNPEIAINRAIVDYQLKGRPDGWIKTRLQSVATRNKLTSEWGRRGVQGKEYGILTDVVAKETFAFTVRQHRDYKGIPERQNLRDHMTDMELVLTMLGEASTTELARAKDAQGFQENERVAHDGGKIAGDARKSLERQMGRPICSRNNFLPSRSDAQALP